MVSKDEFDKWIKWLRNESPLRPPESMVFNYWSWEHRALLARFLMREKFLEPAFRLMETVIEQKPDLDDHYAWALYDLGCLYWRYYKDKEKAVYYLEKSIEVLDNTEQDLESLSFFSEGGNYLSCLLNVLAQAGDEIKSKEIALQAIERYKKKYPDAIANSYLYYAYLFLAEIEKKNNNLYEAIEYLKKGLAYSVQVDHSKEIYTKHPEHNEELYELLVKLSQSMTLVFDV